MCLLRLLGLDVSIIQEGLESKGKPADFYISKKTQRDPLELKNVSLSSLELGYIYVFNLDKESILTKKASSPDIFKVLNPNISTNLEPHALKSKVDNMSTYINKEVKYKSELGEFFLAKNPDYANNAKIPIIVVNVKTNTAIFCNSKRNCAQLLSNLLEKNIQLATFSKNNWIDSGEIIQNNFVLFSKPHFITLIPEAVDFNEGSIDLNKYNFKFDSTC